MTISEATEVTLRTAVERGIIDPKLHAGPMECARTLARKADVMGEHDNVTLPTLLKYLGAMNIVDVPKPGRPRKHPVEDEPKGKLGKARGERYAKFHAV